MKADGSVTARDRQQLLGRILTSREFAHAHILKRILQYLVERPYDPNGPAPKEYEIATQAMGRPQDFDPRTDAVVRVSVASIRDRLLAYFATEGKQETLRLSIPKGQYLVVFSPVASNADEIAAIASVSSLVRFWKPYLGPQSANVIGYTEPLFFRDDSGHYIRDWYVNYPAGSEDLRKRLPQADLGELYPSFHYLSTGEVHCMLSVTRMFHEMGVPIETRNCRTSSWNELGHANLILLGSPRTNSFLRTLQSDEPFAITSDRIDNRTPEANEATTYEGERYLDGKLVRMTEYALVTRRPGLSPVHTVTMIAANHGRAIEGAGHFLTLEDRVQGVIASMGLKGSCEMPPRFQLLMRVETIDVDDEVLRVDCVAHRVLSSPKEELSRSRQ